MNNEEQALETCLDLLKSLYEETLSYCDSGPQDEEWASPELCDLRERVLAFLKSCNRTAAP